MSKGKDISTMFTRLEDRSSLYIDCDDGWDDFIVANGKSYQRH